MQEGHYAAHIRRMRLLYGQRRTMLVHLVERRLGPGWLNSHGSDAGLHLVLNLPDGVDDTRVVQHAYELGVLARPLSRYYSDNATTVRRQGLLLGYACVQENEMVPRFEALVKAIQQARREAGSR
jgi:GntR family transcriptional regulator/MocR family aminotransferase